MAGRSILERDLVSRLDGARRQGFHVADSSDLRPVDRASTCRVVTARGLEARWPDIGSRRSGKEVSSWASRSSRGSSGADTGKSAIAQVVATSCWNGDRPRLVCSGHREVSDRSSRCDQLLEWRSSAVGLERTQGSQRSLKSLRPAVGMAIVRDSSASGHREVSPSRCALGIAIARCGKHRRCRLQRDADHPRSVIARFERCGRRLRAAGPAAGSRRERVPDAPR